LSNPKPEKVGEMYDAPAGQGGHIIFEGQFHWGYWDETNPEASLGEAADRLTQIMIDKSAVSEGKRFCDLGCGIGIPAMRIARAKGCFVDGITISKYQYEKAKKLAQEAGMCDRTHFMLGNALEMPCDDGTYDGGWFFETIFHMGHREALREAYRILKPGATLLIADLPTRSNVTEEFKIFAKDKIHSVFIPKEDYPRLLDEVGFDLIEMDDVTDYVIPSFVMKSKAAFKRHESEILQYVDSGAIDRWIRMFEDMCNNLGYILVTARKRV
jgi:ubiquinone/menaquinone biosynthesis C-methylase UbiE